MFKSLKRRLELKVILYMSTILLVVLGITTTMNMNFQNAALIKQGEQFAFGLSNSILNSIRYPMLSGKQEEVQRIFEYLGEERQIDLLFLTDNRGIIKRCTDKGKLGTQVNIDKILRTISKAKKNSGSFVDKKKGDSKKNVFTIYSPVNNRKECHSCHGKRTQVLGLMGLSLDWRNVTAALVGTKVRGILISILSVLLVSLMVVILIRELVLKPINKLVKGSQPAAEGDLTAHVQVDSEDEIGKLARVFNTIISSLHDMVKHIKSLSANVASFAQEVSSSSKEMNASTGGISSTVQKIAKGVTTQAKRIEDTSQLMENMSRSVRRVAENANQATKSSKQVLNEAQHGGNATNEAVEKMGKIIDTVTKAASVIKPLGEKSQQIGQITETITNIADQTNLLALNAAIEAARAGEAGRGFAVVAEEVRKLAEGSAEAARRIGALIKGIQVDTPKAVSSIEAGTKEVNEGALIVGRVSSALAEIIEAAKLSVERVEEITTATEQQFKDSKNIAKAVNEVAVVAEESAAATEEASSSAQEQTASMEELTASSEELAKLSSTLQELVNRFKVAE